MVRLGFVGTGTMGSPIATHLAAAGHELRVHDRSPGATAGVVAAGATAASSAAEAASGASVVFLSLPGPPDVEAALTGAGGVLAADPRPTRVVDLSTSSPAMVHQLHERCAADGVSFVDAPVSGGRVRAVSGELSVMVGGSDADVADLRPLLDLFAAQVFHVGPCGTGTVAKLVNNQLFLAAAVLVQEAYVTAAAAGLAPSALHPILKASSSAPYVALAPLLLGRDFDDVIFRLDIAAKDLTLAVDAAQELGVDVPVTTAAVAAYRQALRDGHGAEAFHVTLRAIEETADLELPPLTRPARPT